MHPSTLLPLAALAAAAPAQDPTTAGQFAIKVHVPSPINPDCHSTFEGGYVLPYHTGAGLNDAVLSTNATLARSIPAYINGTALSYSEGGVTGDGTTIPFTYSIGGDTSYDAFLPARVPSGYGGNFGKFFVNETGIQFSTAVGVESLDSFAGWLVCDWSHGNAAQLFVRFVGYGDKFPRNCEAVELLPEYVAGHY